MTLKYLGRKDGWRHFECDVCICNAYLTETASISHKCMRGEHDVIIDQGTHHYYNYKGEMYDKDQGKS